MRKQLNYTCMLKNLLKLYCIWTCDAWWVFFFLLMLPLWWDNYRTTSEAPSPGLEAEERTPKLLRLKLHCIWTWRFFKKIFIYFLFYIIYIYKIFSFIYLFFIFIITFIFIFYFQSSLCLSNTFSAYCWLVHSLLFISLKLFLFVSLFCFLFFFLLICFSLFL
jgi:hypothetical protein